ncbi:MFS transporter [Roseofilum sp. BLCC_M154]|uniref:MFS transporter n=1 Tax=Roseofilum acuticapitatum BLCC-M154 TaxID=3022444 RepID=A0ABT7ASQ3_9CYAN|nr:MFS transporter [Roseofilum acuticapitatum]MDJ1169612.1 MFS transporter [Roseofilum acuticapitatum BLCC-M154]
MRVTPLSPIEAAQDRQAHPTISSVNNTKTVILAGVVGNAIEWYDFALYGYLAPIISLLFFPHSNELVSLLETYGVFAAGFIMRPIGAGVFGYIGDRVSRRTELFISVILMAIPTFCLGLLPTYNQIGIAAPIILILLRLVQGLSVGGEFTGSITYLAETAPQTRRGFTTSFVSVGATTGFLLGLGIVTLLTHLLSDTTLYTWGWRLPFLFGGILGLMGLYIRTNLPDSQIFEEHQEERQVPLLNALRKSLLPMLQAMCYAGGYNSVYYIIIIYLPTYLDRFTDMPRSSVLAVNVVALSIMIALIPLLGWVSDSALRRKSLLLLAILGMGLLSVPGFWLLLQPNHYEVGLAQMLLAIAISPLLATSPAMMVELFPTETRLSAYSISYNLGASIMGGTSLLVCTWLINISGNIYAPALYLMISAAIAAIALAFMSDRSREPLL